MTATLINSASASAPNFAAVGRAHDSLNVPTLKAQDEPEVLAFLARRPLHTVFMCGLIKDNGLVSELNRGTFYAHRDRAGKLDGVALIGHATLAEAHSEDALNAFAQSAPACTKTRLILGEHDKISRVWDAFTAAGHTARSIAREHLLEQRLPVRHFDRVTDLRPATLTDIVPVMEAHAAVAFDESGTNPMHTDPLGFRLRTARRIEQGRVWVWIKDDRLIFKADVVSDTPEVAYVEGVYVAPEERGKDYGSRCMMQMGLRLLARSVSVSLLVNEQNEAALRLYYKAGFQLRSLYDTIFIHRAEAK